MKTKKDEIYSEWLIRRQSVTVPEGFDEKVMGEVARHTIITNIDVPIACRLLTSRPVQWAAALGALLLGLFRLSYITTALLIP
jgi:hypothetical protein